MVAVEAEEDLEAKEVEEAEVVMVEAAEPMVMAVANQEKRMVLISVIYATGIIKRNCTLYLVKQETMCYNIQVVRKQLKIKRRIVNHF